MLSYIFGAALHFKSNGVVTNGVVFKEAIIQFVPELYSNALCVVADAGHLIFSLRSKLERNDNLVVLNLCEHIGWHSDNCAQNALDHVGVSHLQKWLQCVQMSAESCEC